MEHGAGKIKSSLKRLDYSTTYYFRAYATTASGETEYGEQKSFKTLPVLPQITTDSPSDITLTSAVSGGDVVSDGGDSIIARGICLSKSENPSMECEDCVITEDGEGTGRFTSFMTDLVPRTTYYVRAYATNSFGTGYGLVRSFDTAECSYPKVSTSEIVSVTSDTACIKGEVVSDCGIKVIARGICWNTTGAPQIELNDRMTKNGSGKGSFTACIKELESGIKYYVRAYATNKLGKTAYGVELSFTTLTPISVSTIPISNITDVSAESGGNVISDGGYPITEQGICWGPIKDPLITCSSWNSRCGKIVSDSTGIGRYSSFINGLEPDTEYYVRAYVISEKGVFYGNQEFLRTAE